MGEPNEQVVVEQELEQESIWNSKRLTALCWPLIGEQFLAVAVGLIDTMMVTAVSEAAMSGVSLVDSINNLLIALFSAMATGGAVVCSQYMGKGDNESASSAARQLIYVVATISTVIMLLSLTLRRPLLSLIYGAVSEDVMGHALTYMMVTAISFPFLAIYNGGVALFRSMGNSRIGMFTAMVMNVINFSGNSITIFVLGWGVFGAALATLISRIFAAIFIITLLCRKEQGPISLRGLSKFSLEKRHIRSIMRIGVPNGAESSIFQVGKILVSRLTASFGTAAIAANAAASSLATFVNVPGSGIGLALITVVGHDLGAGNVAAAKKDTKRLMKVIYIAMLALSICLFLFRVPLISLFGNLSDEAKKIGVQCLLIIAAFTPLFWPTSFGLPNALRASGDTKFTMLVSIFSMFTFRIGFAYLFADFFGWGVPGIWAGMGVDWIVRSIFFVTRWLRGTWQKFSVID